MEDLREEIEKELVRTEKQFNSEKSKALKFIAQGRVIAYNNVLTMIKLKK